METFDEFCDRLEVTDEEVPHAFAAYLGQNYDWDGRYEKLEKEK